MDRESGSIEIALGLEAGLAHEVFIFRLTILGRLLAEIGKQANWLEVHVEHGVGVGQQADCIRRGAFAQEDGGSDSADYEKDGKGDPENTPAMSH